MSKNIVALRNYIRIHLEECKPAEIPNITEQMKTPAGRKAVEDRIVDRIANHADKISEAVSYIEIASSENPEFY